MSTDKSKRPEGTAQPKPMDASAREQGTGIVVPNAKRECYALKTLVAEVEALFPETVYEASGYDGRNTALDVTFAVYESPGLAELLSLVKSDERVMDVTEEDGHVLVEFHPWARTQDSREPFNLASAWLVLAEGYEAEESGSW